MSGSEPPRSGPFASAIARIAGESPPEVANDAIAASPRILAMLGGLDGRRLAAWLGGLLTVPGLQANADRLEWAVRLALGCVGSGRAPRVRDLSELLNRCLVEARVDGRDDPVEDFFVAPVITAWGEFRTYPGRWEGAIASTEDMLEALTALPDWPGKVDTVVECLALLRLGDEVARRSGPGRREVGSGDPWADIAFPSEERLRKLAARVRFTTPDLARLGISREALEPFVFRDGDAASLLARWAGDTALELRPLAGSPGGLTLALPSGLTTAVRARIVSAASAAGLRDELHWRLFVAQARRIDDSGYAGLPSPRRRPDGVLLRESILDASPSRVIHFVHSTSGFEGWPQAHFGSIVMMGPQWHRAIQESAEAALKWAEARHSGAEVLTVLIMGGWGGGRHHDFPAMPRWQLVTVPPEALEILSTGDDGNPEDVFRLQEQLEQVRGLGIEVLDSNGLVNMVAWWARTQHTLVPGDEGFIEPPHSVMVPIDMVLAARVEAAERLDARALPRPTGPHLRATRAEPHPAAGPPPPVYVATRAMAAGRLSGAAVAGDECWWIDLEGDPSNQTVRETWKAGLRWLGLAMTGVLGDAGPAPTSAIAMRLAVEVPEEATFDQLRADPWDIRTGELDDPRGPLVTVGAGWQRATARAANDAELALGATLLVVAASLRGEDLDVGHARGMLLSAVGSRDFRFRHALHADGALGLLAGHGLLAPHRPIPTSAGALLKCGSAFLVRAPDEPRRIEGKGPCLDFLQAYMAEHWRLLLAAVDGFDRVTLVVSALSRLQSASNEQRRWRSTAAALRAVHGAEADLAASHDVMVRANGTMRAASLLAEIAASEAPPEGGAVPGAMDVDDLLARVLMLFVVEDSVAALRLDRARAVVGIGPTGEVLFEHEFEERTLRRSSTVRHGEERDGDVAAYERNFDSRAADVGLGDDLARAVSAEFGSDFLAFVDLSFAPAQLCIDGGSDVVVMRRSELVDRLERLEPYAGKSLAGLVARLTLPSRAGWGDLPTGATAADFDVARFDRRWSVSARPVVALTADGDPLVALAPGVVQRAVLIVLGGAMTGSLQGAFWEGAAMRRYAGVRGGDAGMAFNHEVAGALRALDLRAESEWSLMRCLGTAGTPELVALGDVDVLAVSPDGDRVWVVEAKELKLCRTLGEAARRLSEYRGLPKADGRPDKLLRHLQRVACLRGRAEELGRTLGLPRVPAVSGVVMVGAPQPMEQAPANLEPDARVVRLADAGAMPWAAGWGAAPADGMHGG